MMFRTLRTCLDARGVATLTLSRPAKHNALDAEMIAELTTVAQELGKDVNVRAVILRAEGDSFCAGGDLDWMQAQFDATRSARLREARALAEMFRTVNTLPKPLIAAVNGHAYGGGIGLMCVCDAVIALETAQFALTETRLGLVPATIAPYVVSRIGEAKARRIFLSPRMINAAEARDLGLVSHTAANPNDLAEAIEVEVASYLQAAPHALAAAKALARSLGSVIDDKTIADTIERLADVWESEEARLRVAAFLNSRKQKGSP